MHACEACTNLSDAHMANCVAECDWARLLSCMCAPLWASEGVSLLTTAHKPTSLALVGYSGKGVQVFCCSLRHRREPTQNNLQHVQTRALWLVRWKTYRGPWKQNTSLVRQSDCFVVITWYQFYHKLQTNSLDIKENKGSSGSCRASFWWGLYVITESCLGAKTTVKKHDWVMVAWPVVPFDLNANVHYSKLPSGRTRRDHENLFVLSLCTLQESKSLVCLYHGIHGSRIRLNESLLYSLRICFKRKNFAAVECG